MGDKTGIQWTDATWNPVTGCSKVSPGCAHCYAEQVALRFWPTQYPPVEHLKDRDGDGYPPYVTETRPRQFTDVLCHEDRLDQPLRWKRPRRIFVNSMSDLFHEAVPDAFIDRVFAVMALAHQHTFQVLTKRPERMQQYLSFTRGARNVLVRVLDAARGMTKPRNYAARDSLGWPYRNVWLGVSVENQHFADERIPLLLQTPAAVRFISAEPLLGYLNLFQFMSDKYYSVGGRQWIGAGGISWVIVGGESGKEARPFDLAWARNILRQCKDAGVACFVKQFGARPWEEGHAWLSIGSWLRDSHGGDWDEWPTDLRVREFPKEAARTSRS